MSKQKKKQTGTRLYFNRLRTLAIVTVVLTITLTCIIIYESLADTSISGGVTSSIQSTLQSAFNIETIDKNLAPTALSASIAQPSAFQKTKLNVTAAPSNANPAYTYTATDSSGNDLSNIIEIEDGYLTCKSLTYRNVVVTLTSTLNPNVTCQIQFYCYGLDIDDERIESFTTVISSSQGKINETQDSPLNRNKAYYLLCEATIKPQYFEELGLTDGTNKVVVRPSFDLYVEGEKLEYAVDYERSPLRFYKDVDSPFEIRLKNYSATTLLSDIHNDTKYNVTIDNTVKLDENNTYIPTSIRVARTTCPENLSIEEIEGVNTITFSGDLNTASFSAYNQDGKTTPFYFEHADENAQSMVSFSTVHLVRLQNNGECDVYAVSRLDPSIRQRIHLVFKGSTPTSLTITSSSIAALAENKKLSATFDNGLGLFNEDEIVWTIVDGEKNAEIDSNVIFSNHLGTVTVRAQSVYYPELYDEMTITIKFYDDFYTFVRKILGHAFLYCLLGMGFGVSYFLLIKKRWLTYILTPATIFLLGAFGEFLQGLTPGRFPRWVDVEIDFIGGMAGMAVAVIILAIVLVVWRAKNKSTLALMRQSLSQLNLKTIFSNTRKMPTLFTYEYAHTANDAHSTNQAQLSPLANVEEVAADDISDE